MKYFIIRSPARNMFRTLKNIIISTLFLAQAYICHGTPIFAAEEESIGEVVIGNPLGVEQVNVNEYGTAESSIAYILGIIGTVTVYIGSGFLVIGIMKFALALKDDRPEEKTKAIVMSITGIVLISLYAILRGAGILKD